MLESQQFWRLFISSTISSTSSNVAAATCYTKAHPMQAEALRTAAERTKARNGIVTRELSIRENGEAACAKSYIRMILNKRPKYRRQWVKNLT